jgi:hypothetical protein
MFYSPKKTELFCTSLKFLGQIISQKGIEPDQEKIKNLIEWPVPRAATDVRAFLGLVRYISTFLPHLADLMAVSTPLTMKSADKSFPMWETTHQEAFQALKTWYCPTIA